MRATLVVCITRDGGFFGKRQIDLKKASGLEPLSKIFFSNSLTPRGEWVNMFDEAPAHRSVTLCFALLADIDRLELKGSSETYMLSVFCLVFLFGRIFAFFK